MQTHPHHPSRPQAPMRVNTYAIGSLLGLLFAMAAAYEWWTNSVAYVEQFRQTECELSNPDSAVVQFEHRGDLPRRVSFSRSEQLSAIYFGYGTDVAVEWTRIANVRVARDKLEPGSYMFAMEFVGGGLPTPFKFGLVEKECLDDLRFLYSANLKFVDD